MTTKMLSDEELAEARAYYNTISGPSFHDSVRLLGHIDAEKARESAVERAAKNGMQSHYHGLDGGWRMKGWNSTLDEEIGTKVFATRSACDDAILSAVAEYEKAKGATRGEA